MAKILHLVRPPVDRRREAPNAPCEVVIFPGIRVEYHEVPPDPAGKGGPSPRRGRSAGKRALTG